MARERQKITEWEYPYNAVNCVKNMKEYGIGPALSHDWERTKENINSGLEKIALGALTVAAICISIPMATYKLYKMCRAVDKRDKMNNQSPETLK